MNLGLISPNVIWSGQSAATAGHVEGNPAVKEIQAHLGAWWSAPKVGLHLMLGLLILWLPSRKMVSMARRETVRMADERVQRRLAAILAVRFASGQPAGEIEIVEDDGAAADDH